MKYYYTLIFIFKFLYLLGKCQNESSKSSQAINPTGQATFSITNTGTDIQTVTSPIYLSKHNITQKCKYGTVFNGNSCDG